MKLWSFCMIATCSCPNSLLRPLRLPKKCCFIMQNNFTSNVLRFVILPCCVVLQAVRLLRPTGKCSQTKKYHFIADLAWNVCLTQNTRSAAGSVNTELNRAPAFLEPFKDRHAPRRPGAVVGTLLPPLHICFRSAAAATAATTTETWRALHNNCPNNLHMGHIGGEPLPRLNRGHDANMHGRECFASRDFEL